MPMPSRPTMAGARFAIRFAKVTSPFVERITHPSESPNTKPT
jgi:hypothetical protein